MYSLCKIATSTWRIFKAKISGYYMNKEHWNSLYLQGDVPDEIVKDMLDKSYNLVLASLSKKLQREIMEKE